MTATYFAILTEVGAAKEANAIALGLPRKYTMLGVGDGGSDTASVPTPDPKYKALLGERRRKPLNALFRDPNNPSQIIAEQVIPENEGGWWVREMGLYDEDGDLCAYCNAPPTYKPLLAQGSGLTQTVRMVLIVSPLANVELKIDPSVVLATRQYADNVISVAMKAHTDATDPHPQYFPKTGGIISGPVTVGDINSDKSLTRLKVYGRVRGISANGALTAANGGGTDQTSIFMTRDDAPVDEKSWEILFGSTGTFSIRALADNYKTSTTVFSVDRPAGTTSTIMRLMQGNGRVLVKGATDDGINGLQVAGGIKGALWRGALVSSNGGGTGQTSVFLTRDGAPADYKTWELYHGSDGIFALRQVSEDYTRITTAFSVAINETGSPTVMRLMSTGGRVLVNAAADDATNALQVKGGAVVDTPAAGDRSRRVATTDFVGGELGGYFTKEQAISAFAPGLTVIDATADFIPIRENNWVTMIAGGGGGGAGGRDAAGLMIPGGGGGAGANVYRKLVKLTVGVPVRVTIGKGGAGATSVIAKASTPLSPGSAGGASSFGTYFTLPGGGGGGGGFTGNGSVGGPGGVGFPGGGAGGYSGTTSYEASPGGAGGNGLFGGGGAPVNGYQLTGANGYGAGGAGGALYYMNGTDSSGGRGGDGFCIVEY